MPSLTSVGLASWPRPSLKMMRARTAKANPMKDRLEVYASVEPVDVSAARTVRLVKVLLQPILDPVEHRVQITRRN
jgi:hypothetical protein